MHGAQDAFVRPRLLPRGTEGPEPRTSQWRRDADTPAHGQFYDLHNLLSIIKTHMVIFNGDFVDRGSWSVEVVLTLFAYKWLYPERVFLNRGNHETADMNKVYGFEGECKAKHGEMTYQLFADVFTACEYLSGARQAQRASERASERALV